jgi:hypothetical protein
LTYIFIRCIIERPQTDVTLHCHAVHRQHSSHRSKRTDTFSIGGTAMCKTLSTVLIISTLVLTTGCSKSDDSSSNPTSPDDIVPGLSVNDITADEGTEAQFTITLTPANSSTVTWRVHTEEGTATANEDYRTISGSVQIPAGVTSWTIRVQTLNDTLTEGPETFYLTLFDAVNAPIADSVGMCTIQDEQ